MCVCVCGGVEFSRALIAIISNGKLNRVDNTLLPARAPDEICFKCFPIIANALHGS